MREKENYHFNDVIDIPDIGRIRLKIAPYTINTFKINELEKIKLKDITNDLQNNLIRYTFNKKGQLFLQKRSLLKENFPGLWDSSVAGHLDAGEDYDLACLRESKEELNVTFESPPGRLFKIDACQETGYEFIWVYRGLHEGPFSLNRKEIDCGKWYNIEEIRRWVEETPMDFTRTFVLIWDLYHG